jgi:hypothetical protein
MKNSKKLVIPVTIALAIGVVSFTAFAASTYKTPTEAVAGLTGSTLESVTAQKVESGETYGSIAQEAGVLEAFKEEMLELKKDQLAEKVEAGTLTQERADEILAVLEENIADCDGSGGGRTEGGMGAGFGSGKGSGGGMRGGQGGGQGGGMRNGQGGGGMRNGQGAGCTVEGTPAP